jgi:nucleoside-diphosphate-sugar epimerase
VGRALLPVLAARGMECVAAVRRGTVPGAGRVVAVGDIGAGTDWGAALAGCDAVVHLAARVHVMRESAPDPVAAFRAVNTAGTGRLARAAVAAGVKRLVFLSSVKVHGEDSGARAFGERDEPAPADAYALSKWEAELELARVAAGTGLAVTVLRPPLVYGPGAGGNFARLVSALRRGLPLPFASIRNRRSLVYVENLADAIAACLREPAAAGRTFLVSDGEDLSTPELLRRCARAMGVRARLLPCPPALLRAAGTLTGRRAAVERLTGSLAVDSGAIRAALHWRPPFTVDEALARTLAASSPGPDR